MVFTEGTILMHKSGENVSREERVTQVINKDLSVKDYTSYIPIGNAVSKITSWVKNGAKIVYLTSRREPGEIKDIRNILNKNMFPEGILEFRKGNEAYKDVAERIVPDILIEDDCESIGGDPEMTFTCISENIKDKIKSIPVKEFGGIDHLPENLDDLINF